jgi:predicted metal-dependent TIM-barrel fold hydrolase
MGAYLEYNLSSILFPVLAQTFPQLAAIIKNVGAEHCVLTSDMGQSNNPSPVEGLRILIVNLLQLGISEKEIDLMTRKNPAYLLGLK